MPPVPTSSSSPYRSAPTSPTIRGFSLRRRGYAPMPLPAGLVEDALERLLPDPERLVQLRIPDRQRHEDPDDVRVRAGAEQQQAVAEGLLADGRDQLRRRILRLAVVDELDREHRAEPADIADLLVALLPAEHARPDRLPDRCAAREHALVVEDVEHGEGG